MGLLLSAPLSGASIRIFSEGTATDPGESNSIGATVVIAGHPAWATSLPWSSWVSFGPTGDPSAPGYFMPANGTIVSFFEPVSLPFLPVSATLTFRADDSAALHINNVLVRAEAPVAGNNYTLCSDFPVGCIEATEVTLDITPYLRPGDNMLRFDVAQRNSVSYGLNYLGVDWCGSDGCRALAGAAIVASAGERISSAAR